MSEVSGEVLYVESVAGIAGDMFSAACVDAELIPAGELEEVPNRLGFGGVSVRFEGTTRAGLAATHLEVVCEEGSWERYLESRPEIRHLVGRHGSNRGKHGPAENHSDENDFEAFHVPARAIESILDSSDLSSEAVNSAKEIFREIAGAEAKAHGTEPGLVHFHEIGRIDSIVDSAMAGVVMALLAPSRVFASNVKLGHGNVRISHGVYPVPPPASANLSEGFPIDPVPESIDRENLELSTPTGLAILKVLKPEFTRGWPSGRVLRHGYGAGTMDLGKYPNVTRVVWLERAEINVTSALPFERGEIVEIVCNLDDQSPERTAWLQQDAIKQGALDVWITPVVGKKNRPAQLFSMLVDVEREGEFISWMLRCSSTFGLRTQRWDKVQLARRIETRDTPHGPLRFKIGMTTEGEVIKEKPEYDDLAEIWKNDPNFRPDSIR